MPSRVVITGFGAQTPLGCSFAESQETIARGDRCVDDIENLDTRGYDITAAGEIRSGGRVVRTPHDVDRKVYFFDRALAELAATTGFAERYSPEDLMLNAGGGTDYFDFVACIQARNPSLRTSQHPLLAQMRDVAARWHIAGGCNVFVSACTASAQAIGLSYRLLKGGWPGAIISGGTDSMISHAMFLGFRILGALADTPEPAPFKCKPFDLNGVGTVLGEASVAILLENADRVDPAREIYGEIIGYGSSADAWSVTDPAPDGVSASKAIEMALADAHLSPEDIDCLHLHGTGTPKSTPAEYKALERVFGDRAREIPAYSMKGQTGHTIGACTAVEMLGVAYSLREQAVPVTVNFETPHPDAPLKLVRNHPLHIPIRHILKLNSAFGGHNSALIIKKWER